MKSVKHLGEAEKRTELMRRQLRNKPGYATGGRVKSYTAGAESGQGRLDKIKNYGSKARPNGR